MVLMGDHFATIVAAAAVESHPSPGGRALISRGLQPPFWLEARTRSEARRTGRTVHGARGGFRESGSQPDRAGSP